MASFRKRGVKWEAGLCVNGVRRSATFETKREAVAWAASQTVSIKTVTDGGVPDMTVSELIRQYGEKVTPRKRSCKDEMEKIAVLLRDELATVSLQQLKPSHLAAWRDRRLSVIKPGSVLREWSLLSHILTIAVKEWEYLPANPLRQVTKPKAPPSRDRRITEPEIAQILLGLGYSRTGKACTTRARVAVAFLFAIETGMRRGEILGLRWESIKDNVARLNMTKNGFPRFVPLSSEAVRLLGQLKEDTGGEEKAGSTGSVFRLSEEQIQQYFTNSVNRAGITNLHFHDTRHEAITRLARKLDVLDLARMVGTRDLKVLMVYYNATPSEIAARLG